MKRVEEKGLHWIVEPVVAPAPALLFPAFEIAMRWVPGVLAAVSAESAVGQPGAARQAPLEEAVRGQLPGQRSQRMRRAYSFRYWLPTERPS